jgi:glucosylglycerate synthase
MSTAPISEVPIVASQSGQAVNATVLLVCLPSLNVEALHTMRTRIAALYPDQPVFIASPGSSSTTDPADGVTMLDFPAPSRTDAGWALTSFDYLAASQLSVEYSASATLVLGAEAASLAPEALQMLANAVLKQNADLAVPRYDTGPHDALVSSALLYPLTHALFGATSHLPLPLDVAMSPRMAARLAGRSKPGNSTQNEPLLWPVAEAAIAGLSVKEIEVGGRILPHPSDTDLNSLLAETVGSLFSDIESKASFWQRARAAMPTKPPVQPQRTSASPEEVEDVRAMAESFRNAYANLQEIWALVLPPQSLLGLKKVSRAPAEDFDMPVDLWARTVYDFVLAYHLRTINRGHLLGALTPLYLAWVASHLRRSAGNAANAALHIEESAAAFVAEKPYIVARWRWPDRFNP